MKAGLRSTKTGLSYFRRYDLSRKKRILAGCLAGAVLALLLAAAFYLIKNKILTPAMIQAKKYEVRGVDVSRYQGEIDWEVLSREGIEFAF